VPVHWLRRIEGLTDSRRYRNSRRGGSPGVGHEWRLRFAVALTGGFVPVHWLWRTEGLEGQSPLPGCVDSPSQTRQAPISAILEVPIILDAPLAHDFPVTIY
jgi:hypothetical protein